MIRIHHYPKSRSMRILWQCEEMGLPYEVAPVTFPVSEAYRKLNPIGAVPFLEDTATGAALNESVAMMLYLATEYGPTPLLPGKGDPALARTMQFLVFGEATVGGPGNVQVGAKFFAPAEHKANWSATDARARMLRAFAYAADALGDADYFAGDRFTLADISMAFVIAVARSPMLDCGAEMPAKLLAYHDRLAQRPAYQRAAAK